MTPTQKRIVYDPYKAYAWAKRYKRRFPEAEPNIAGHWKWAYFYARDVIMGRWPEGEAAIASRINSAYKYAQCIIKGRFLAGEPTILRQWDVRWSVDYAAGVVCGQWPEGEKAISSHGHSSFVYARDVLKARFLAGEPEIAKDPNCKNDYLHLFPESMEDWAAYGWVDWLDT